MQSRLQVRRALLVAVGDYNGVAANLPSAVPEMTHWQQVLAAKPYEFTVTPLSDKEATREKILPALHTLLDGLAKDDQAIFGFFGHGAFALGWNTSTVLSTVREEALIAYPATGDLQKAAITISDFERIWGETKPLRGTDITMILECCFASQFAFYPKRKPDRRESRDLSDEREAISSIRTEKIAREVAASPHKVTPLFAGIAPEFHLGSGPVRSLFDLRRFIREEADDLEPPLIIAATRRRQAAYEIPVDAGRRLLFSYKALEQLEKVAKSPAGRESYQSFRSAITPLLPKVRQTPKLIGDRQRKRELMFGEPTSQGALQQAQKDSLAAEEGPPFSITVRILGLCCVIPPKYSSSFERRIVMPYDDVVKTGSDHHFAFLEIAQEDVVRRDGLPPSKSYLRGSVDYLRWDLTEHRIEFDNDDGDDFTTAREYELHVPKMRVLCPELEELPRDECYVNTPNPDLFSLFVDLDAGHADIGYIEATETTFIRPKTQEITWGPENTSTSVKVLVPTTGPETTIVIYARQGLPGAEIVVRSGASIMVGNAREKDITGNGSGGNPSNHFKIMYKLADPEPLNPPFPFVAAVPIDSCSVNNWP